MVLDLGASAPDFHLPATDGKAYGLKDFASKQALCVIFSCNHCPYVQAYEGRFIALQKEFGDKGGQIVAINSNDASNHPEDSFEEMVKRAQAQGFNFPYLRDESQAIARAYGAIRTPHVFLFNAERKLAYAGRIDDCWDDPQKVKSRELAAAFQDILAGQAVKIPETYAVGCTIKWKD